MTEPVRRTQQSVTSQAAERGRGEPYASDVLLIADSAETGQTGSNGVHGRPGTAPEPLDMESVVRKLIALLSDTQAQ
jgi:hypothetical protein